jgi:hypothetical protein
MNEETVMQPEYDFCRSTVRGFCRLSPTSLEALAKDLGLLSGTDALCLWQGHFSGQERRDPLVGELRFFDRLTQQQNAPQLLYCGAFKIIIYYILTIILNIYTQQ